MWLLKILKVSTYISKQLISCPILVFLLNLLEKYNRKILELPVKSDKKRLTHKSTLHENAQTWFFYKATNQETSKVVDWVCNNDRQICTFSCNGRDVNEKQICKSRFHFVYFSFVKIYLIYWLFLDFLRCVVDSWRFNVKEYEWQQFKHCPCLHGRRKKANRALPLTITDTPRYERKKHESCKCSV